MHARMSQFMVEIKSVEPNSGMQLNAKSAGQCRISPRKFAGKLVPQLINYTVNFNKHIYLGHIFPSRFGIFGLIYLPVICSEI